MATGVRASLLPISSAVNPALSMSWSRLSSMSVQRRAAGFGLIISAPADPHRQPVGYKPWRFGQLGDTECEGNRLHPPIQLPSAPALSPACKVEALLRQVAISLRMAVHDAVLAMSDPREKRGSRSLESSGSVDTWAQTIQIILTKGGSQNTAMFTSFSVIRAPPTIDPTTGR
jgi:hypothetical protein